MTLTLPLHNRQGTVLVPNESVIDYDIFGLKLKTFELKLVISNFVKITDFSIKGDAAAATVVS